MKFKKTYLLQNIRRLLRIKNKTLKTIDDNNNMILKIQNNTNVLKKNLLKIDFFIFNKKRIYNKLKSKVSSK